MIHQYKVKLQERIKKIKRENNKKFIEKLQHFFLLSLIKKSKIQLQQLYYQKLQQFKFNIYFNYISQFHVLIY